MLRTAWSRVRDFSALGGGASYLWPRWILLRCVGLVYVIIFAGIIVEGRALADDTGQSAERVSKDTDRDFIMTAAEAVDYGLIDEVISARDTLPLDAIGAA